MDREVENVTEAKLQHPEQASMACCELEQRDPAGHRGKLSKRSTDTSKEHL